MTEYTYGDNGDCEECGNYLDENFDCEDSTCPASPHYVEDEENPYNG